MLGSLHRQLSSRRRYPRFRIRIRICILELSVDDSTTLTAARSHCLHFTLRILPEIEARSIRYRRKAVQLGPDCDEDR